MKLEGKRDFLNFIEEKKKQQNFKYVDLAQELNISRSYLSHILSGVKEMSLNRFFYTCDFLGYEVILKKKSCTARQQKEEE
ncbi:MAG: helix-turn-helix domain-containing protein [Candidatus Margulisbacteria bacterium]|nr:helix-turn-helix domain-containing protein [Candidatus Margulisiibacteriota bacterium]